MACGPQFKGPVNSLTLAAAEITCRCVNYATPFALLTPGPRLHPTPLPALLALSPLIPAAKGYIKSPTKHRTPLYGREPPASSSSTRKVNHTVRSTQGQAYGQLKKIGGSSCRSIYFWLSLVCTARYNFPACESSARRGFPTVQRGRRKKLREPLGGRSLCLTNKFINYGKFNQNFRIGQIFGLRKSPWRRQCRPPVARV